MVVEASIMTNIEFEAIIALLCVLSSFAYIFFIVFDVTRRSGNIKFELGLLVGILILVFTIFVLKALFDLIASP
jgi:hypothetical protein